MIKACIHKLASRFGYRLERLAGPVDVRAAGNDPRQWLVHPVRGVLISAPAENGRIRFFPLSPDANPFVRAVTAAGSAEDPLAAVRSVLARHYAAMQPRNIYEWTGLTEADAPGLSAVPIWAIPEPWTPATIAQKTAATDRVARRESQRHGRALPAACGDKGYGPVSAEKLRAESARLCEVFESIRRTGYRRQGGPDGDIEVYVFIQEDGAWRWQVSRGLHRAAVLAALGAQELPVRVKSLVFRRDAGIWPNVLSGLYTRGGAEKFFDRIFTGVAAADQAQE